MIVRAVQDMSDCVGRVRCVFAGLSLMVGLSSMNRVIRTG